MPQTWTYTKKGPLCHLPVVVSPNCQVGLAISASETDLTRHKRACILSLMAMWPGDIWRLGVDRNGPSTDHSIQLLDFSECHAMSCHNLPMFWRTHENPIILSWSQLGSWALLTFRYLPHDKGLAEEATSRFQRWLDAPDRQDVLPDDLKTSMFKTFGVKLGKVWTGCISR